VAHPAFSAIAAPAWQDKERIMAGDNKVKLLRDAEKYVMQGKLPQAITEYLKIVKSDPNDVLTLNTVGDLHLRLGKVTEARKFFSQVAEYYARNNFLLKAIAVYKKILNVESDNLEVNLTLASLYLKQGLTVEARNRFLRVADCFAAAGKTRESVEAYEKVVELDPLNAAIQLKLADIYAAEGDKEKAHLCSAGAARAQAKAGDLQGSLKSFQRAAQLNPTDIEVLKGLLDVSTQIGDVWPVLEQLKAAVAIAPDGIALREVLGRAYLAGGDPENASRVFQQIVDEDETHYVHILRVSNAFLDAGDPDRATSCLDAIVPILIGRREADRAIEAYNLVLKKHPRHVPALTKLAAIYSATNNQSRYVETLEKVAQYHLSQQSPAEALEHLEKIIQVEPDNHKYLTMHRQAFLEAFPGSPYRSPVQESHSRPESRAVESGGLSVTDVPTGDSSPFVEVDLLLTYGMPEKAIEQLQILQSQDPLNPDISRRLLSLYKDSRQNARVAEQCLMLAVLARKGDDDLAAERHLEEAKRISPASVPPEFDLIAFAQRRGIALDSSSVNPEPAQLLPGIEVDLTGDLSEIFFKDGEEAPETEVEPSIEVDPTGLPDAAVDEYTAEEYTQASTLINSAGSVEDKLQEIDFYIRLGFHDEARAKLDEVSRDHPNCPQLPSRYSQLHEAAPAASVAAEMPPAETPAPAEAVELEPPPLERCADTGPVIFEEVGFAFQSGGDPIVVPQSPATAVAEPVRPTVVPQAAFPQEANTMFADLIDEVNSLTTDQIAREEFDTHFNLGIAYREMELLDDAVREFQDAIKTLEPNKFPREVIRSCAMLSTCYLDRTMHKSAIRWCQAGLNVPDVAPHEAMAFRYDMGIAYDATGESERALECFSRVFGMDPTYRDVAQRIDQLRGNPGTA
jgi:pilus assembly protein FimV